jgi:hypothetical protein
MYTGWIAKFYETVPLELLSVIVFDKSDLIDCTTVSLEMSFDIVRV